mmetsp:Transcript_19849/g.55200  ORF Transcript_19849/g.55200 Transcript_19849/m.55200 type:complete len:104 (-) Transcript_19849:307-618(-)
MLLPNIMYIDARTLLFECLSCVEQNHAGTGTAVLKDERRTGHHRDRSTTTDMFKNSLILLSQSKQRSFSDRSSHVHHTCIAAFGRASSTSILRDCTLARDGRR